jgi:hypothetical protein
LDCEEEGLTVVGFKQGWSKEVAIWVTTTSELYLSKVMTWVAVLEVSLLAFSLIPLRIWVMVWWTRIQRRCDYPSVGRWLSVMGTESNSPAKIIEFL